MSGVRQRLVNTVEGCVDDSLAGLVAVHPGLSLLKGHRRVVIRTDIQEVIGAGKVTILTGGGSGHEPGHPEMVGPGMASAAVAGPMFTSPPPGDILAALRALGRRNKGMFAFGTAGVLVMYYNYTGDRLTFGQAIERARKEGIKLDVFINADDCALETADKTAGRRGLAGGILTNKIAGALAEEGKSLAEILKVLKDVSQKIGTIGLCLSPCSLPGAEPSFQLNDEEMALGLGLHGEAGVMTLKMMSSRDTVKLLLDHMTKSTKDTHLQIKTGDHVACLLNNLGTLTIMEMNIIAKDVIDYLERRGVVVERFYSGHYVTAQEMSGISITILHLNDTLRKALDANTTAPIWRLPCLPRDWPIRSTPADLEIDVNESQDDVTGADAAVLVSKEVKSSIYKSVERSCRNLISAEERLNKLDTNCGDGDCGHTFRTGASAILTQLGSEENPGLPISCPYRLAHGLASLMEEAMGGSSGGLYSLFMTAASGALKTSVTSDAWCDALRYGTDAVMRHGGAKPGYRTMLDALCPAVEAFSTALKTSTGIEALGQAVKAAEAGALSTVGMKAQAGRASYVADTCLGEPDPGAVAVGIWMRAILEVLTETQSS